METDILRMVVGPMMGASAVIYALVTVAKRVVPERRGPDWVWPLVSVALALVFAFGYRSTGELQVSWPTAALVGLASGAIASGAYSWARTARGK